MAMLPGNPNGMIFLKVVTEDGATKTIRCEPSTTIAEIKEQFSYRLDPNEHRICFADGRVGDENSPIGQYGVAQNAFIYLRNKNLTQRRASAGPRPAWADTGLQSTVLGEKPVAEVEGEENEKGRMAKLRQFISHFLKRRPSPQQLVDAKILNEAPVSNTTMQPNFEDVQRCIEWLRKYAMHAEGLFRVSGSAQENTTFSAKLVNHKLDIENYTPDKLSPHAVTTGLKIYFREKTAPVIPYKYYKEYMENYRKSDKSANSVRQNCQHMISTLPENNRRILVLLCKFLSDLAKFESDNKMNSHNLGVVFGPTLMRTESTGLESLTECDTQIAVVEELIMHINEIDPNSIGSPESVPSACGSAAAAPAGAKMGPVGAKPAAGPQPKSPSGAMVPPPMLVIPKNGSKVLRSTGSNAGTPTDSKKNLVPPQMPNPGPNPRPLAPSGLASPTMGSQPSTLSPSSAGAQPAPGSPTTPGSKPETPVVQSMPPAMRPPPGAAPTPGKPPMGHAPVPGVQSPPTQPLGGSKLKLVPKFKVSGRAGGAPTTPTGAHSQPAIQQEIHAALASPADPQRAKLAAAQLSNMFENQPQDATELLSNDLVTTASFILLLGRTIATNA